jgi:hypothetical protein
VLPRGHPFCDTLKQQLESQGYKKVEFNSDTDAQGRPLTAVCVNVKDRRLNVEWTKHVVEQEGPSRNVVTRFVSGSTSEHPTKADAAMQEDFQEWQRLGYEVRTLVRHKGKETAVDGMLQTRMTKVILTGTPGVDRLVVCTGDGNDNHGDLTFPELVEGAAQKGFHVRHNILLVDAPDCRSFSALIGLID